MFDAAVDKILIADLNRLIKTGHGAGGLHRFGNRHVASFIGADSLAYLSVEGLVKAIGMEKTDLCLGCLTGEYPVEIPGEKHRLQKTLF